MSNIKLVDTVDSYLNSIDILTPEPSLAIDIETYVLPKYKGLSKKAALDPHYSSISTIQMMGLDTQIYIFDLILLERAGYDRELLLEFLKAKEFLLA